MREGEREGSVLEAGAYVQPLDGYRPVLDGFLPLQRWHICHCDPGPSHRTWTCQHRSCCCCFCFCFCFCRTDDMGCTAGMHAQGEEGRSRCLGSAHFSKQFLNLLSFSNGSEELDEPSGFAMFHLLLSRHSSRRCDNLKFDQTSQSFRLVIR